jgi:glycosyltransferase involved in cell wall biosynthesis
MIRPHRIVNVFAATDLAFTERHLQSTAPLEDRSHRVSKTGNAIKTWLRRAGAERKIGRKIAHPIGELGKASPASIKCVISFSFADFHDGPVSNAFMIDRDPCRLSILIGAESLYSTRSGVGRMTLEIARAAQQAGDIDRVELLFGEILADASLLDRLTDDGIQSALEQPPPKPRPWRIAVGRLPGVQRLRQIKHGGLNRKVRRLARETGRRLVYHEPNMITTPISLPTVVTMSDLSWYHHPAWHPVERMQWIERNLARTLRDASRFVAISEFTKCAVVKELGIPADRVDVVPLAPSTVFQPVDRPDAAPTLARYGLTDRSYVFSISTIEPRKNFDRLLTAYLQLPAGLRSRMPLVIAGGQGWGDVLTRPDAQHAIRTGMVRMLGHVPDADLPLLCARAGVFAYVSLYEGFGLPVVEAMAAGAPVLASATTAVGELAAGAAILVDPLDTDDMALKLQQILEDEDLADDLRLRGLEQAAQYSWMRTIDHLAASWRHALG